MVKPLQILLFIMLLLVVSLLSLAIVTFESQSVYAQVDNDFHPPNSDLLHHHIHNFGVNYTEPSLDDYIYPHRHALQMGYNLVSEGKPSDSKFTSIGVIKDHNAAMSPIRLRFNNNQKQYKYFDRYHGPFDLTAQKYRSALDQDKLVNEWYTIDQTIIDLIKMYGCARAGVDLNDLTLDSIDIDLIKNFFFTGWEMTDGSINFRANWQNKTVVSDLVQKTIGSLQFEAENNQKKSGIFFDQFGVDNDFGCSNADYNQSETYANYAEGQREFVRQVSDLAKEQAGATGDSFNVTVNIGNAITKWRAGKYYADGLLRLDHYYLEQGKDLVANGVDPETGRPAYIATQGYIPVDKTSVDALKGWYGVLGVIGENYQYREDDYFNGQDCGSLPDEDSYFVQHLKAAGIAGKQGSWFGYYGEDMLGDKDFYQCVDNVPVLKTKAEQELVYTNDLQLLRAIPNWDNLDKIPIRVSGSPAPTDPRYWNEANLVYQSTNSFASPDVIYSRHFQTGELFVVFVTLDGMVELKPEEQVVSAYFANKYFEKTIDDARDCLNTNGRRIALKPECSHRLKNGIRISGNIPPYANGLVSHWNLDEASGSAVLDTVSGNHGTVTGAVRTEGVRGTASEFDGVDDLINFGDILNMEGSNMSISFWMKTSATNTSVISKAYETPYYNISLWTGKVLLGLHNGAVLTKIASSKAVNDNSWHHVAVVWDRKDKMKIFLDGQLDNSVSISQDKDVVVTNNNLFTFGTNCKHEGLCGNKFAGILDEVKVFNKALTTDEVNQLYSFNLSFKDLILDWLGSQYDLTQDLKVNVFDFAKLMEWRVSY